MSFVSIRIAEDFAPGVDPATQAIVDQARDRLELLSRARGGCGMPEPDNPLMASLPAEIENLEDRIVLRLPLLGFDLSDVYVLPSAENIVIEARVYSRRIVPESCVVEVIEKRLVHQFEFACEIHPGSVTATLSGSVLEVAARKMSHGALVPLVPKVETRTRKSLAASA